jgi:hypothetical protein
MPQTVNSQAEIYRIGAALREAKDLGFITNAGVTAADTNAGLLAFITGVALPKGSSEVLRQSILRAVSRGKSYGILTDAAILALTTSDALIALTGVPADYKRRSFLN